MVRILDFINNSEIKLINSFKKFAEDAEEIDIAVAYVKNSGLELTKNILSDKKVRILFTFEFLTTDPESIERLIEQGAECREYRVSGTEELNFHPKLYIFKGNQTVRVLIGSSNFTAGGLLSNVESCLAVEGSYGDEIIDKILNNFERIWKSSKAKQISEEDLENYKSKKRKYEEACEGAEKILCEVRKEQSYANSVIVCMTKEHDKNDIYNRLIGVPDGFNGATKTRFFEWIKKGTRIFIYYNSIGISKIVEAVSDPFVDSRIVEEWRDSEHWEKYPNRVKTRLISTFPRPVTFGELKKLNITHLRTGNPLSPAHLRQSVVPISDADGDAIEEKKDVGFGSYL